MGPGRASALGVMDILDPALLQLLGHFHRHHPWHGVGIGKDAPDRVTAYIELVPTDTVKYEMDKRTGYLRLDRPQRYSNICPTLYGLIPQTFCDRHVAAYCEERAGRTGIAGDGDPLDICVLTEKSILHGDILVKAIPIGGMRMIDGNEADDKIVAVLQGDAAFGTYRDIRECPASIVDRLKHYFLTYKNSPDDPRVHTEVTDVYGRAEAHEVIRRSRKDYAEKFKDLLDLYEKLPRL